MNQESEEPEEPEVPEAPLRGAALVRKELAPIIMNRTIQRVKDGTPQDRDYNDVHRHQEELAHNAAQRKLAEKRKAQDAEYPDNL